MATIQQSQFATRIFGTGIFGQGAPLAFVPYAPPTIAPGTVLRATYRLGRFGVRNLREPYNTNLPVPTPFPPGTGSVSFTSRRGVFLGIESTGIRRPNIVEAEWSRKPSGGCREGRVFLRQRPKFPLRNFMIVSMGFDGQTVFTGYARLADVAGSTKNGFEMVVTGLYRQLDDVHSDLTVVGPIDLGVAAKDLFLAVQSQTDIGYNPSKINQSTGVASVGNIDLAKHSFVDVFNAMAIATNHVWGVDQVGDLYFLPRDPDVQRAYSVGYEVNEFEPQLNFEQMINQVIVARTTGKGSGGAGWEVASSGFNAESVANFGVYFEKVTIPGFWETSLADQIRNEILARNAFPRVSGEIKNIPLRSAEDLVEANGPVRVIGSREIVRETFQNCETLGQFTLSTPSGNAAISLESSILVSGATSLKITTIGDASGDFVFFNLSPEFRGFVRTCIYNILTPEVGDVLEFGVGRFDWQEHKETIGIPLVNSWFEARQDVTGLLRHVGQIGFRILTTATTVIYIDQIDLEYHGLKHNVIELEEVHGMIRPDASTLELKLGPQPQGIDRQMAALKDLAEWNDYNAEIR